MQVGEEGTRRGTEQRRAPRRKKESGSRGQVGPISKLGSGRCETLQQIKAKSDVWFYSICKPYAFNSPQASSIWLIPWEEQPWLRQRLTSLVLV